MHVNLDNQKEREGGTNQSIENPGKIGKFTKIILFKYIFKRHTFRKLNEINK